MILTSNTFATLCFFPLPPLSLPAYQNVCCVGMCGKCEVDNIRVEYFDRQPWKHHTTCCGCQKNDPKLELLQGGTLVCCQTVKCCSEDAVVIMPFEKSCGCCGMCCGSVNRVTKSCANGCGCCGEPIGNPKSYYSFVPQPKNAAAFVKAAQSVQEMTRD